MTYDNESDTYTITTDSSTPYNGYVDEFGFAYAAVYGANAVIEVNMSSFEAQNDSTRVGIMFRSTLDDNSPLVDLSFARSGAN